MKPNYSFKKTVGKGAVSVLTIALAFLTMSGFADFSIWELIEQYGQPLVSGITVGGLFTMAINFVKINWMA